MFRGYRYLLPVAATANAGLAFPEFRRGPIFRAYSEDSPGKTLPVVVSKFRKYCKKPQIPVKKDACKDNRTELEKCADICRRECKPIMNAAVGFGQTLLQGAQAAVASIADNIEYLQKCTDPEIQRAAILGAGVVGILFGFRRRWPRKLLYSAIGSGAMCSIIYPNEAEEIARDLCGATVKLANDAYKAVAGDRPGYKCPETNRVAVYCPKKKCTARARKECRNECKPKPQVRTCTGPSGASTPPERGSSVEPAGDGVPPGGDPKSE